MLVADFSAGMGDGISSAGSLSQNYRQRNAKKFTAQTSVGVRPRSGKRSTSRVPVGKIIPMADETSARMERLESHVAHLEHQLEQLNEVVTEQSRLVEHLKKQVQRQSGVLETIEMERIKANTARPPHH